MFKDKTILITGGTGSFGNAVLDRFLNSDIKEIRIFSRDEKKQHDMRVKYNNSKIKFYIGDVRDESSLRDVMISVDYVFHAAALKQVPSCEFYPIEAVNTNIMGTVKVLEAARLAKVKKFVYAASSSCYGLAKTPTSEIHKINPLYPYAMSKYQGEKLCFHWHKLYKLPVNSIRIFNAYGPRVRTTGAYGAVFGVFFKQKLENKPFTVVGNGNQKRDFVFVTDVADAFYKAAIDNTSGQTFNLGSGKPKSVNQLVKILGGKKIYIPKRPGEPEITHADITKLQKFIDWKPKISINDGINLLLDNIDYWKEAPIWDPDSIAIETKLWFKHLGDKE